MSNTIESCYIIRQGLAMSCIYSDSEGGVFRRKYNKNGWSSSEKITDGVTGNLSVNISEDGGCFLFCTDISGNIVLHHFNGKTWSKRTIQKLTAEAVRNLRIHSIIRCDGIHLLYNIPAASSGDKGCNIVFQETSGNEWLPIKTAVENAADSKPAFIVQRISAEHYIVYYQALERENSFGYKEFYMPDKWGGYVSVHQTLHSIADKSVVTTKTGIHAALIVRGLYSSQLIYRQKFGATVSAPIVLFEANRMERVSLFLHSGKVFIFFSAGGYGFFKTVSSDGGKTFSRPARISVEGRRLIKAEYIGNMPGNGDTSVYDMFTDADAPGEAPLIDKIIENFYTYEDDEPKPNTAAKVEARNEINDLNELLDIKSRKIAILENKLESSYREISEKNRQIIELNSMLNGKSSALADAGSGYRETIMLLREELSAKNQTISSLESLLESARAEAEYKDFYYNYPDIQNDVNNEKSDKKEENNEEV